MRCAKIVGLAHAPQLNGRYVEILTPLEERTVPEHDGVRRTALRYGARVMDDSTISGYFKPENLEEADYRAVHIHLFGTEPRDT